MALYSFLTAAPASGRCCISLERDQRLCNVRRLFALLALLLASLLLLAAALLLTFLALLGSASSEAADEPLGLIGNPSDGILNPLHRLPGLIGYLACSILRSSALLLTFLALLLLLRLAGLGGARLL
jgi:uncharacterized protein YggT (Ycf19 family)